MDPTLQKIIRLRVPAIVSGLLALNRVNFPPIGKIRQFRRNIPPFPVGQAGPREVRRAGRGPRPWPDPPRGVHRPSFNCQGGESKTRVLEGAFSKMKDEGHFADLATRAIPNQAFPCLDACDVAPTGGGLRRWYAGPPESVCHITCAARHPDRLHRCDLVAHRDRYMIRRVGFLVRKHCNGLEPA